MNTISRYSQPALLMICATPPCTTSLKGPGSKPASRTSASTKAMEMRNTMAESPYRRQAAASGRAAAV